MLHATLADETSGQGVCKVLGAAALQSLTYKLCSGKKRRQAADRDRGGQESLPFAKHPGRQISFGRRALKCIGFFYLD